jgi:Peptidase C13 family
MNPIRILSDFMQAVSFASAVVLLVLQIRAFRRHSHLSFALLSVSTVCALLYFAIAEIMGFLAYKALPTPVWLYPSGAAFLVFQIVFGTWGTIALFTSYRRLSETVTNRVTPTLQADDAPNTATLQAALPSTPPDRPKPTFLERLNDVVRLWLLGSSRNTSNLATEIWIVALAVLTLCLWIVLDRLRAGPNANFMSWNIPALGSCLLLALGLAFIASRTSTPRIPFRMALYVVTAVAPLLVTAWWLADTRIGSALFIERLLGIYAIAYMAINLRRLTGTWQLRATALVLVTFGLVYAAEQQSYWSASVWIPAPTGDEEDFDIFHRKSESLLFDQRSKIDAVVQRFDPSPEASPRVFFVGFAGVSSQRVFAEEIKFGEKVVASRFNVKDRQLLLLNDRRDLTTFPIGTVTSLTYGLKLVGQRMNPDRDILFLALSSHGSSDPLLSVSNGSLGLQQLTGENLSAALQASGIKRRIIVISACHAAAFIPQLKNPDTVIITAAAADKTSFGCSDDRDLTYFGEAFYRDALPNAQNLEDAFKRAKEAIALRETQEHQKASEPEAYFGDELQRVLDVNPMAPPRVRQEN